MATSQGTGPAPIDSRGRFANPSGSQRPGARTTRRPRIEAPQLWKTLLEYRAVAERAQFSMAQPCLRRLPRGDGRGVLVLPGFTATDGSTEPLRKTLRRLDHRTYAWRLGTNLGPTPEILEGLYRRLEYVFDRTGRPVNLIGWSLGGIYARELARALPEMVHTVITLGSPIQMTGSDRSSAQAMWKFLAQFHSPDFALDERDVFRPLLSVPNTSIYTRTDGVVHWQASLIERTAISENIQVFGSHIGLGFNTSAVFAIADRLTQSADDWHHFSAPWWLRGYFPPADDLDARRLPDAA